MEWSGSVEFLVRCEVVVVGGSGHLMWSMIEYACLEVSHSVLTTSCSYSKTETAGERIYFLNLLKIFISLKSGFYSTAFRITVFLYSCEKKPAPIWFIVFWAWISQYFVSKYLLYYIYFINKCIPKSSILILVKSKKKERNHLFA